MVTVSTTQSNHEFMFFASYCCANLQTFVRAGYFGEKEEYKDVPGLEDYYRADLIVDSFMDRVDGFSYDDETLQDLWTFEREEFVRSTRVLNALAKDIEGVRKAAKIGAARYSVPNAQRSLEWLKENGRCLDNIKTGKSTIPEAGRGALATRAVKEGDIVTASPMLQHNREFMVILNRTDDGEIKEMGKQLILNYMYGHKKSNLLFLPIAPAVHAINHNTGEKVNTKMQWSTLPFHKSDWMNKTAAKVLATFSSGLIMDFVAIRDIEEGEEIFIDYGPEFDAAWKNHVENWEPSKDADTYQSSWHFSSANIVARTKDEEPYPENILIHCAMPRNWYQTADSVATPVGDAKLWVMKNNDNAFGLFEDAVPCEILDRVSEEGEPVQSARYTVRVEDPEIGKYLITGVPHTLLYFVDKRYTIDDFLAGAFRHEIHVPNEVFPESWLDLDLDL